jgi:hypothetical protein
MIVAMYSTKLSSLAILIPLTTFAADVKPLDAKLGLWETTTTTETAGMPAMPQMPPIPPETLARMPPEQRAKLEALRKGGLGAPRTHNSRSCVTREVLERGFALDQNERGTENCTNKVVSSSSARQEIQVECTNKQMKSVGDIVVNRIDSGHIQGQMLTKISGETSMNMKMTFDSKWISSDCGDVKPPVVRK